MLYRFFVILALLCMPMPAFADMDCNAITPPRINVKPSQSHIKYDFSKTKAELNAVDVDTISPYGAHHNTQVSGLMSGAIQLKSNVGFMHETHSYLDRGCLYLKTVDVEIVVEPTIFIASEFKKGSCMHNAIMVHEMKHVSVDQQMVNKYTNIIGKKLGEVIDSKGSTYGPMKKIKMNEIQMDVKNTLHDTVIRMNDEMNVERRKRQQAIDNIEEYESIGKGCEGEIRRNNAEIRAKLDKIIK